MYCMKCGTQNTEEAKFCIKCGTPTGTYEIDSAQIQSQNTQSTTKRRKWLPVLAAILLIFAIILVFSGSFNNATKKLKSHTNPDGDISINGTGFSLDTIASQCPECENALKTYIALMSESDSLNSTKESIDSLCEDKYYQMQHTCTADVIEVENVPYAYRGSVGTYTGQWKGAGPSGYGTYKGSVYWTDAVSYTGEWQYGLPDGEGELYIEKFKGGWDMEYKGHMTAGKRNGNGYIIEYNNDSDPAKYRIYDATAFQNDVMCVETGCVQYNAETGEVLQYYRMTGTADGWVEGISWGPNELSPEDKQALEFAQCAIVIGAVGYLMDSSGGYDYNKANEEMLNNLNEWRSNKESEEKASIARQEEEQEEYKHYCSYKYEQLHANDPTDWSLDAQYFKYNMN